MFYVSMKAHDNQKIPIENTQMRIRKVSKHITAKKNQWNTKKESEENKNKRTTWQTENNWQNGNSKSFSINNNFKCKQIEPLLLKT